MHDEVLTVFAAFLGQFEYFTKQRMPWQVFATKPDSARRNIPLDYLTPLNIIVVFKAIKASYHLVSLAITASFLLRALIVFSPGLLSLQAQLISTPTNISTIDTFNLYQNSTRTLPADLFTAIWTREFYNLTSLAGATADYATQSVDTSKMHPNAHWEATLDVFSADLSCECFDWAYPDLERPYFTRTYNSSQPMVFEISTSNQLSATLRSVTCSPENFGLGTTISGDPSPWNLWMQNAT
ncbi:hypothetical protein BDZ45DRAFT_415696 [Acephala macrosclerotiorum]|nr:hypothetical protein BDZ45DRAFT_415696 [Acephala macrosclerotiorum]